MADACKRGGSVATPLSVVSDNELHFFLVHTFMSLASDNEIYSPMFNVCLASNNEFLFSC
jgi:hypothetical protein